jgi:putative FmdB family regulatory protein
MPIYEYRCPGCYALTEELRSIKNRDVSLACNRCETPMHRVISATPGTVRDPAVEKKIRDKSKRTSFL